MLVFSCYWRTKIAITLIIQYKSSMCTNIMAEKEDYNLAKEISEFLQKSCQQLSTRPRTTLCSKLVYKTCHPVDGEKCRALPVVTGSIAEFYIDQILKCIGDVDIMYHYSNEIAIPEDHQPPTQLPTDFSRRVKVFELVNSHVPCYVYLRLKCNISQRKNDSKYMITECASMSNTVGLLSHELYLVAGVRECAELHGPSACMRMTDETIFMRDIRNIGNQCETIDTVPCVRCLVWPTQADSWPTRHRNYGWPDSATVERVISNGCDVVGVAHSSCSEHDEWMSKHQWRLSFSRAEVVLLNSWTPAQQIIYHMLRIFMKTERLINTAINNAGKSALSNYHIKTFMLWACEQKPMHWWTDTTNLISLYVKCLYFLDEWISKKCGQHYFVNSVYFLDYVDTLSINTVTGVMKSMTEDYLAEWFVVNYMRKCAELCPVNLPILCSDMITKEIVHNTATGILRWTSRKRCNCNTFSLLENLSSFVEEAQLSSFRSWKINSIDFLFYKLQSAMNHIKASSRTDWYSILNECREFAHMLSLPKFFDNANLDTVAAMCWPKKGRPFLRASSSKSDSLLPLRNAVGLMKTVADQYPNNHQIVHVNLAKGYLIRALTCDDADSDSVYDLTNVYTAVIYYITGQYQKATDHCTLVTRSQTCPKCSLRVVNGEILPKIDDNIDTVLDLAVFYQYMRMTTSKQQQQAQHVTVFTTKLFAHYFNIRHLLVAQCCLAPKGQVKHALRKVKCHLREELILFNTALSAPNLFVTDVMLLKCSNNSSQDELRSFTAINSDSCSRQQVVRLLTQMPIEQMLKCGQSMLLQDVDRQFAAVVKTSDFTALRLYRCRLYGRCAQFCQRVVYEIINGQVRAFARLCFLYCDFVQLMDDDIVSLTGMTVLVNISRTQTKLKDPLYISELTMSLYLLSRCQMKIHYSNLSFLESDISPVADVLDLVSEAEKIISSNDALDHLILKLAERLSVIYITERLD